MNKELGIMNRIAIPLTVFLIALLNWEISVQFLEIEKWLLPAPSLILASLWNSSGVILTHSMQTICETFLGLIIAIILGIALALIMEWSVIMRNIFKPLVIISQTIPFIVLAPLLIIWLGYGVLPKIVVVVLACFFPICMNVFDGFRAVDGRMHKLLQSMGANRFQQFRYVTLPASLPYFFSGLRVAGAYAVGVAVVSEWLGAEKGLGIFLLRSAKSYQTEAVFASILVISVLSLLLVGLIELSARRVIPWHYAQKGTNR